MCLITGTVSEMAYSAGSHVRVLVCILVCSGLITEVTSSTCLVGHDAPNVRDITRVRKCGPHESCFLDAYLTPSGFLRYEAGCRDKRQCGSSTVSGLQYVVCSECCDGNLCQPSLCGNSGYPADGGPVCFYCLYPLNGPQSCDVIKECSRDDVCGMNMTDDGRFEIKCLPKSVCEDNVRTSQCALCCNTTVCNDHCNKKCEDDPKCQQSTSLLQLVGKDVCTSELKTFCNATCGLCPNITSPITTKMTSSTPITSPTTPITSPTTLMTSKTSLLTTQSTLMTSTTTPTPTTSKTTPTTSLATTPSSTVHVPTKVTSTFLSTTHSSGPSCTCSQNGDCRPVVNFGYMCICHPGYTGNHCNHVLNDCNDVEFYSVYPTVDNIYHVIVKNGDQLPDGPELKVVCNRSFQHGGWTMILSRQFLLDFTRDSNDYAEGFGSQLTDHDDYWIGLAKLYGMMSDGRRYQLYVRLLGGSGHEYYQVYQDFTIGAYSSSFTIHVGNNYGTAGDGLSALNGNAFVTKQSTTQQSHCAIDRSAGWWYPSDCGGTCLTCNVKPSSIIDCSAMFWDSRNIGTCRPLRLAQMFFKPM